MCYREDSASLVPHLCPSPGSAPGPSSPALPGAPSSAPAACAAPSGGAPAAAHPWQRWEPSGFRRKSWSRTSRPAGPKGSVKARPGAAERRWQPGAAAPAPSPASRPRSHLLLGGVSHPAEPAGRRVPLQRRAGNTVMDIVGAQHPLHLRGDTGQPRRAGPAALPRAAPAASPGPRRATRRCEPPSLRRAPPWPHRAAP